MSCKLERVSTRQTSMAATALPLELQQQVFSYLDTKSFYYARKVCKYWRFASTAAVPLARQLRRLPILPPVDAATATPAKLQDLFEQAAQSLMIGVSSDRAFDKPGSLTRPEKMGFRISARVAATRNGNKTVSLNDRTIALFDTSGEKAVCVAQRSLNDLKENIGNGPWLQVKPNTYMEMALSSDGNLLAIAQERTIQIYDLLAEPDSFTVNEYVSSATGHYICGVDFEQDDHVLRVRLSGRGTVLYLGTPASAEKRGQKATLDHWKSKAGLKHTFLDSSLLSITSSSNEGDQVARISGLQLLHQFEDGYLFAGQHHGGGESSYYALGHVKTSVPSHGSSLTVESTNVTILARLESFLSSWDFISEALHDERGIGLWENMPSAHEHHPRFALSIEGQYLALAERDKKRIRPAPLTQLFIYRIPSEHELRDVLSRAGAERKGGWATLASFLDSLERPKNPEEQVVAARGAQDHTKSSKYTIPRIPLCLSTIQGDVTELQFSHVDGATFAISAATVETTRTWNLEDL